MDSVLVKVVDADARSGGDVNALNQALGCFNAKFTARENLRQKCECYCGTR